MLSYHKEMNEFLTGIATFHNFIVAQRSTYTKNLKSGLNNTNDNIERQMIIIEETRFYEVTGFTN